MLDEMEMKKRSRRFQYAGILFLLLFLLGLIFQRKTIQKTGPALEAMAEDVSSGETAGKAVKAFLYWEGA